MGIGEDIKADHDEFRHVLAKMEKTTEKDIALRKQLLPHFIRILYAHHVAEEETLFPAMEKKEKLRNMALDLTEEHRAMMILLNDLEVSGWDFKFWRNRLRPFREIIVIHWKKEEDVIIPHISEYFSKGETDELTKGFEAVRNRELNAK
ncbi:MAG: hemerythrin domain-containing protein [Methanotrichaceae archaeon]